MINFEVGQGPEQGISNLNALLAALNFWQPSTVVTVGDVVKSHSVTAKSMLFAECTSAGTTSASEPTWGAVGDTINDGTVVWTMRDLRSPVSKVSKAGDEMTGNLEVPSLSIGGKYVSPVNFKNKIINGTFSINQRGVSGTVTLAAGQYGHDRWKAGASGCTYTFSTVANITTITISAGSLIQVIEGINLQSGTYVLSWQGTAQGKIGAGSFGASGVTGTAIGGTNLTVEFSAGTLSNVQLEEGSVKTTFEQRPSDLELVLCKRYRRQSNTIYPKGEAIGVYSGNALSPNGFIFACRKTSPMRTTPTCLIYCNGILNQLRNTAVGTFVTVADVGFFGNTASGPIGFTCSGTPLSAGNFYDFDLIEDAEL